MSKSFVLGYTHPYVLLVICPISASWQALFPVWEHCVCLATLAIFGSFQSLSPPLLSDWSRATG